MGRETILIVEGEPSVAGDLKSALTAGGFEVPEVCGSGEEAVERLAGISPDLAIVDTVPAGKMNGIETAKRIREIAGIPIVFLAGYGDMEMLEEAKVIEQYVLKPFDERELMTAIKIAFSQHAMEQAILENEKTIRALLAATTDPLFLLDSYGRFLALNGMMEKRLGMPEGEVLKKPVTDFLGKGAVSQQLIEMIGTARTGKPVRFEE